MEALRRAKATMAANLNSEASLDAQFQQLRSYVDHNNNLADDDFKLPRAVLENNCRGMDLVPLKRAYVKPWTISPDGTMSSEEVVNVGVKKFDELVFVSPVDDDPPFSGGSGQWGRFPIERTLRGLTSA